MNIAQNLKKLMDNRGLSNSRLAREIHVHTSTISNWLEGKEVKAENLTALCEYFGCSLDYLAGTTTEKAPTQEGERKVSDDDIKFALWGTREIDDDVLDRVRQFAKFAQANEKNK